MRFTVKMLLVGLAMIPAGAMVSILGFSRESMYPAGKFAGPVLIVLGLVLIVMCVRDFRKPTN